MSPYTNPHAFHIASPPFAPPSSNPVANTTRTANRPCYPLPTPPALPPALKEKKSRGQQPLLSLAPVDLSVGRVRQQVPHLPAGPVPPPTPDPVRLLLQRRRGVVVGVAVDALGDFEGGLGGVGGLVGDQGRGGGVRMRAGGRGGEWRGGGSGTYPWMRQLGGGERVHW